MSQHSPTCRPGSIWRHRKGGLYRVVGVALGQSSTAIPAIEGARAVVYESIEPATVSTDESLPGLFVRPLDEFLDGRFTPIESPT